MKKYKPTTPGQRHYSVTDYSVLTKEEPFKKLTYFYKRSKGRSGGKITVRHRGGGAKKLYRLISWGEEKKDVPGKVKSIEYDPFRHAFLALVSYRDGDWRYLLAPHNLKVGDEIICSEKAPLKTGNRLKLENIPVGSFVYNIETRANQGGKLVRGAGTAAQVLAQDGKYTHLKMPSSEIRKIPSNCYASLGQVSNREHSMRKVGKAGIKRHLGKRPVVRGTAMNAVDHPYGGGEGRTKRGTKRPKSIYGKVTGGKKTRKKKKYSDKLIVRRRGRK